MGDILGEAQWVWLEEQLKNSTAQINIILSSSSVLAIKYKTSEEWADYPKAKRKLFSMIEAYKPKGLLFVTGDRHFSAYLSRKVNGVLYHEFMASGLTHFYKK